MSSGLPGGEQGCRKLIYYMSSSNCTQDACVKTTQDLLKEIRGFEIAR